MFETAELGQKVSKKDFEAQVPDLRSELLRLQYELRDADFPVIVALVPANDKKYARVQVLKTVCKALRKAL